MNQQDDKMRAFEDFKTDYATPNGVDDIGEVYYWACYWHEQYLSALASREQPAGDVVARLRGDIEAMNKFLSDCAITLGTPEGDAEALGDEIAHIKEVYDAIQQPEALVEENKRLRKIMALAANLNMVHPDGRLDAALREYYNPPIQQPEAAVVMTQANALDIIARHLPDDGVLKGVNKRWNTTARAIVKDLVAEGLRMDVSADEPLHATQPDLATVAGEWLHRSVGIYPMKP